MDVPPTSHLPPSAERIVGLLTLQLLDSWRVWVKRRVEAVTFPDVATQARHISVDFELPAAVVEAAARAGHVHLDHDAEVVIHEARVEDVWSSGQRTSFVLVPLTVLKKQGLTKFSLRDENGTALPLLTRDQTGAVATAVLVTFAEGLRTVSDGVGSLPPELRAELVSIATLPPSDATVVLDALAEAKGAESATCAAWRSTLVGSTRFMDMALDLAENFLLLTRVAAEAGRRRIIKISYEHHLKVLSTTDATLKGRLRRVRRWIGWGAHTQQIETPAVGLGRCFHLEVKAPEGIQATRARLKVEPRSSEEIDDVPSYPNFPEAVSDGKQRVHLHVSVPSSYTGQATVFLRPRPSTIVRSGAVTAGLTTLLLMMVALRPTSFQTNLGTAAALLLLVPGGPVWIHRTPARAPCRHAVAARAAGARAVVRAVGIRGGRDVGRRTQRSGRDRPGIEMHALVGHGYVVGVCAACALVTFLVLLRTLRNTSRPPEQGHAQSLRMPAAAGSGRR